MSSRRALKAAQAIREVVSTAILLELKDPRVKDVTVTLVEVSGDLRAAKVYVSVMGDDTKQNLCLNGLRNSSGFLQQKVGRRIDTRYTPKLKFVLDKGAMNAMEVTRILQDVLPEDPQIKNSPWPDSPPGAVSDGSTPDDHASENLSKGSSEDDLESPSFEPDADSQTDSRTRPQSEG